MSPHNPEHFRQEEARRRDDAAIRTEQQFADFRKQYEAEQQAAKEWRTDIVTRLQPLEDLHRALILPAKVLAALLILMITPVAGVLGYALLKRALSWCVKAISPIP